MIILISVQDVERKERVAVSPTKIMSIREVPDSVANVVGFKTLILLTDDFSIKSNESHRSILDRVLSWQFKWEQYRALAQAWAEHAGSVHAEDKIQAQNLRLRMDAVEEELKNLALK